MAVTLRYFTKFGKPALQKTICVGKYAKVLYFLVRVQCRRKECSRSLSHLLMSFLSYCLYPFCERGIRSCIPHFWKSRVMPPVPTVAPPLTVDVECVRWQTRMYSNLKVRRLSMNYDLLSKIRTAFVTELRFAAESSPRMLTEVMYRFARSLRVVLDAPFQSFPRHVLHPSANILLTVIHRHELIVNKQVSNSW